MRRGSELTGSGPLAFLPSIHWFGQWIVSGLSAVFRFRRPRKQTSLVAGAEVGRPATDNRPGPLQGYTPEPRRIEFRASDGYPHGWEPPAPSPPAVSRTDSRRVQIGATRASMLLPRLDILRICVPHWAKESPRPPRLGRLTRRSMISSVRLAIRG